MPISSIQGEQNPTHGELVIASREEVWAHLDTRPKCEIDCRGWGHAWDIPEHYGPEQSDKPTGLRFIEMTLPCLRGCGVQRYDRLYWDARLRRWVEPADQLIFGERYSYPAGYLLPSGFHTDRATVREYRKNRGRNLR